MNDAEPRTGTQGKKMRRLLLTRSVAGLAAAWCLVLCLPAAAAAPKPGAAECYEVEDMFFGGSPQFEPGKFGLAVCNPIGGHEGLFLWYPNVLPPEGTLSGWVKPAVALGCGPLFYNSFLHLETLAVYQGEINYGLVAHPDRIELRVRRYPSGENNPIDIPARRGLKQGQWNHVAVTFSPRETRLYVDGELAGKGPGMDRPARPGQAFLDLVLDTIRMHCPGLLDQFVLLDHVLSAEQVKGLYGRTEPYPAGDGVVAVWRFERGCANADAQAAEGHGRLALLPDGKALQPVPRGERGPDQVQRDQLERNAGRLDAETHHRRHAAEAGG